MPDELLKKEIEDIKSNLMLKLQTLAWSAGEKYLYYNAKQPMTDLGISLPKNFRAMRPGVGWASRAVNTISDRLNFDGFADDQFGINDLFDKSGANAILNKAKTDALIAGCSFIALLPREGYIELLPFTATEATGTIDERTGLLETGLAVVSWDSYNDPVRQDMQGWGKVGLIPRDYFVFGRYWTARYRNGNLVEVVANPTGRPLLHVLTHRQSADRPFGKSRITVDDCLIAPITEPTTQREEQAIAQGKIQVRIHLPKTFDGDVSDSDVEWGGQTFHLDSDSVVFMNENCPTRWNRYFRAEAHYE